MAGRFDAGRAAVEHAEQAQGVEIDLLERGVDVQLLRRQEAQEADDGRGVEVAEVLRQIGVGVGLRIERQLLGADGLGRLVPAMIEVAEDLGEQHRDEIVAQPPGGRLLDDLGGGDRRQQRRVLAQQRARLVAEADGAERAHRAGRAARRRRRAARS